ncbi:MAG: hypothetical protein IT371_21555 [Deltaproteobacteria bacterium]|nr:hypothetical protein [Deltaproteobacteria bacterium]
MSPATRGFVLAQKLAALPEPAMREAVLVEQVRRLSATEAALMLDEIHRRGRDGGPPFNIALRSLTSALGRGLMDYSLVESLYVAAKEAELHALPQLFWTGVVQTEHQPPREPARELTLGHRKSLARSSDPDVLDRLLRHPEADVVRQLLANPRLTERDVVALAARRPTLPEVQREIFACHKWAARYAVKRALALNPHTTSEVGIRLLPFLRAPDLRFVVGSPTLSEALREAARRLLAVSSPSR